MTKKIPISAFKNAYNLEHYDRINFVFPSGLKDVYKASASAVGLSVNSYIQHCIETFEALKPSLYIITDTIKSCLFETSAPVDFVKNIVAIIKNDTENGSDTDIEKLFADAHYYFRMIADTGIDHCEADTIKKFRDRATIFDLWEN